MPINEVNWCGTIDNLKYYDIVIFKGFKFQEESMSIELGTLTDIAYNLIDNLREDETHEFHIEEDKQMIKIKLFYDSEKGLIHFFKNGKYLGNSEY